MPTSVFTSVPAYMQRMIADVQARGSKITDFNDGSVIRTFFEALAAALSYQSSVTDQLNRDGYLNTASGQALDDLAGNFQVTRLPAVQATGTVSITRQDTAGALVIPAAWGQLSTVPSTGSNPVALLTSADAVFADGQASVTVSAQAILGGVAGNIGDAVALVPTNPVNGVDSNDGIVSASAFTGGVDQESDDALRSRIPLVVQGRVKGTRAAFLAAAFSVPGVTSANVLSAGSLLGDSSLVPPGSVAVFYRGAAGLLNAVQSALDNAAVLNQDATAYASVSLSAPRGAVRCIVSVTVYVNPGTDLSQTAAAVSTTLLDYFGSLGVGETARFSRAVNLLHGMFQVVSVAIPFTDFRRNTDSPGVSGDITAFADSYLNLLASDLSVAASYLT